MDWFFDEKGNLTKFAQVVFYVLFTILVGAVAVGFATLTVLEPRVALWILVGLLGGLVLIWAGCSVADVVMDRIEEKKRRERDEKYKRQDNRISCRFDDDDGVCGADHW